MCHDSLAPGRDHFAWERTVAEQRTHNPHVKDGATEAGFVAFPTARDAKLAALDPGEHPRRPLPRGRGQWRALPQGSGDGDLLPGERRSCAGAVGTGSQGEAPLLNEAPGGVVAINLVLCAILVILKTAISLRFRHAPYHHDDSPPQRRPQ